MIITTLHALCFCVTGFCLGTLVYWITQQLPSAMEQEWQIEALAFLGEEKKSMALSDSLKGKRRWSVSSWYKCYTRFIQRPLFGILLRPSIWPKLIARSKPRNLRPLSGLLCVMLSTVSALIIYSVYGFNLHGFAAMILVMLSIAIAFIDGKHRIIPDVLVYPLLWLGLLANTAQLWVKPVDAIYGAFLGYSLLWICSQVYSCLRHKEAMGHGDMKMLAAYGAWFGAQSLGIILLIACISSLIAALFQWLFQRNVQSSLPFGPSLAFGGFIYLMFQAPLQQMLMNLVS